MATQLKEETPPEAPENNDNDESQTQTRDYEAEARAQGWRPQEEFKGDKERWVDAETFVKRAEEVLPLIKHQNQNLKRQLEILERQVKKLTRAEQVAFDAGVESVKARMREAVETGDVDAFDKLSERLDKLNKEAAEASPTQAEDPTEAFDAFRESNPWYDKANLASASEVEIEARLFADRLADKYAAQGLQKKLSPSEFFERISKETAEKFPLLKAKPQRQKPPSDVAGVTRTGAGSKARTGANLPADAKHQAERFWKQGVIRAENLPEALDKFAKSYQWD